MSNILKGLSESYFSRDEQDQQTAMDTRRSSDLSSERNAGLNEPDEFSSKPVQMHNGIYEYDVPAGQEKIAQELGLQFHKGHWFTRIPMQRADFQFGRPQFHAIPSKKQGVAEGLSKRDQKDVAAIRAAIERLQAQLKQPNADKAAIQQSIAHEKKRLALYKQGVAEGYQNSKTIITEALITQKLWENAGRKLMEAQLTADQINQIFQQVEQGATAAGNNRTMLGQGKDAAAAISKAWEDLKTKVQDSGPIKGVDAMYDKAAEQLKQATGGDQGVMKYVQKYRDFAKKHPVAQSLIYSALIAAAGISGVGIGGAAALGLFKLVDKLLQGEKFSSAAYSGAKTGAMAYAAGQIGQAMKGQPEGVPTTSGTTDTSGYTVTPTGQTGDFGQPTYNIKPLQDLATDPNLSPVAQKLAADLASGKDVAGASNYLNKALNAAAQKAQMMGDMPDGSANAGMRQFMSLQNLMKAADGHPALMKESVELTESQIFLIIGKIVERQRKLDEGIMDTVKGAAGKAVNWAKTKGSNLTTKVTADKLLQAWKKAGSPTDSLDVAKVVQDAGVPSDTIKQVYGNMKVPFAGEKGAGPDTARKINVDPSSVAPLPAASSTPAQPTTPNTSASTSSASVAPSATGAAATSPAEEQKIQTTYAQVRALIDKLDKRGKQNVVKTLKKNLGIALTEDQINELSTDLLANYKKKAGADATAADKKGDYKRGDKRMSGIVKATKKQFANDEKNVEEARYDSGDYYNARMGREYGMDLPANTAGSSYRELNKGDGTGERGRPQKLKGVSKSLPADAFGRTTGKIPKGKPGTVHSIMRDIDEDELDENCWKGYHKEGNKELFGKTVPNCVKNEGVAEEQHSCPHCGGEMVSEELMNEKKDACYYKVKSRYKVWPSAYASGALVKCRKSGADSWGNGGKKNESSILEGIERADENLHKWFKEKWVRFGPDGKIRGDCARGDDSEGKPKCLPQSKAQNLGKEGRASAAARKRREDPNPERSGKAINVNTKKKSNEGVAEGPLKEFAPVGGGGSGDYFQALASAWYNGTFDSGSLQKGIKSQEDVERLLNRGVVCPDGKTRKLHIDYNSDFNGVEIYSDDYYEYGDDDATIDSRTGQKWGPYDFMVFSDDELSEGVAEGQLDEKWSQKYKDSINCSNPKGFSQKAHCQGKNK
jgi:hypothetical protein